MDFLQQSVLPQSAHHIVLLKYLLILSFFIFLPYFALLTGSMFISGRYRKKGNEYIQYSFKIVDFLTFNRIAPIALGFVPMLSVVFIYMQLFQSEKYDFVLTFIFSFLFLLVGTVLVYFYKHYFSLNLLIKSEKSGNELQDNHNYYSLIKTLDNYEKYGKYAKIFLLIGIFLFIASVNYAIDSIQTGLNFIGVVSSLKTIIQFAEFIVISLLLSSILFGYNLAKNDESDNANHIKQDIAKKILVYSLMIPSFILIETITSSGNSLSENYFVYVLISILMSVLLSNSVYRSIKSSQKVKYNSLLFLMFIFMAVFIIKEQYLLDTKSQIVVNKLIDNYAQYENKVKAEFGINTVKVSGADIFNGKCIACHNFDKKVVGPAYKDVLPKYEGKMPDLIKFILNPVKVNPDFPSMPNQGLKPNEAEAIADYITQTYNQQYKK